MLDRQKFVQAVHQALKEHDDNKEMDKTVDKSVECTAGHLIHFHDCDKELEHFADRILELMA
jgi:hypothetical protein